MSGHGKMVGYFSPRPAPYPDPPAFVPSMGGFGQLSLIPGHARLIWLKFIREQVVSMDGQGRFFHPWGRSATTESDLQRRGEALMGELRSQGCHLREHKFETKSFSVSIDETHDIVVLDNYHQMCFETFDRQPKDPAAEDFGQIGSFSRFMVSVDQMLDVARNPRLHRADYRLFWGPLGDERPQPPTVFILLDNWNPNWVKNEGKAEWASDLLVVNGIWDLSLAFQQKVREIEPLLQLVSTRINVEYCHWRTLHN